MISIFSGGYQIGFIAILLVLLLVLGIRAADGIREWRQNNQAPVLTGEAVLLSKERTRIRGNSAAAGSGLKVPEASVTWTLIFYSLSHGTVSLEVTDNEGRLLEENMKGSLTWQGSRFIRFVPAGRQKEKN